MFKQGVFVFVALALVAATACTKSESSPAGETSEPTPSSSDPAPGTQPQAPAQTQTPAVDAAPLRTDTMRLVPSSLSKTDVEGEGKHCLDCNVRKARYEYCYFEIAQLTGVVGADNVDKEVTLNVAMTPTTSENYKPQDPNSPQPEGGFTHSMFSCRALSVEANQ